MPRRVELEKGELTLKEDEVEGFLEREAKPIGAPDLLKLTEPLREHGGEYFLNLFNSFESV